MPAGPCSRKSAPAGLPPCGAGEQAPRFAAYQLNSVGRPVRKLGSYDGKTLKIDSGAVGSVAFGPDVEDFKDLPKESLVSYRVAHKIDLWRKRGLGLGEAGEGRTRRHLPGKDGPGKGHRAPRRGQASPRPQSRHDAEAGDERARAVRGDAADDGER